MSDTYKRKYGLDWPKDTPDFHIELSLAKKWREEGFNQAELLNPVSEHMLRAIRLMFTPQQVVIHPWMETVAKSWCEDRFSVFWGAASCGKSHALGLLALLDYVTDPGDTYIALASTTKEMLLLRSFASVTQHLSYLKANRQFYIPLKYVAQSCSIVPDNISDEDSVNFKARIRGTAVSAGTEAEARASLQGVHLKYVRLILDELEGLKPGAVEARHNLAMCEDFRLFAACNPESFTGLAGKFSRPKAGWNSVTPDSDEWLSDYGKVYRFDAFKSPGIKEPKKYPFLPTQATIDRIVETNAGNLDSVGCWVYLRAFPPAQGLERTVLTPQMIDAYGMTGPVVWRTPPVRLAACDPAFTSEGDNAILAIGSLGTDASGQVVLAYDRLEYLKIEASSKTPVTQQLVTQIKALCDEEDVPHENIGFDDSGNQSVADAYEMFVGRPGVYRINFAASAPDLAVSAVNSSLASERYKNRVTWLYYLVQELGQRGQLKGLPAKAVEQFCSRRLGAKQKPLTLEGKKEYKKRMNSGSPDEADACAILAGVARERLGLMPGASELFPGGIAFPSASSTFTDMNFVRRMNNLGMHRG